MKNLIIIFFITSICNAVKAQDTIYIYKLGIVINKQAIGQIDSIIFYNAPGSNPQENTIKDADGNDYHTIDIGDQTWMVENLKTTKYNDGTPISNVTDNNLWANLSTPAYSWLNNDITNKPIYGALYNWFSVNTGKLAPAGWHVPSSEEWTTLENYLIANGYNYDGTTTGDVDSNNKIAKAMGAKTGWYSSSMEGTIGNTDFPDKRNASGFTALPGGCRDFTGLMGNQTTWGYWWNTTEANSTDAIFRYLRENNTSDHSSFISKNCGLSVRCIKDKPKKIPTVTTNIFTVFTDTSVNAGGKVTSDGGIFVNARGLCWNTSHNPTISNYKTTNGTGIGYFSGDMKGLTPGTKYYFRAYATNSIGTAYGDEESFIAPDLRPHITDVDGNIYYTVTIGTQTWTIENLKTTKFNDGTAIPNVTDDTAWANLITSGVCALNNTSNADTINTYGRLYNWYAVNTGKLAPIGWHVPTDDEWTTLENYLISNGFNYDGTTGGDRNSNNRIAKALASTTAWQSYLSAGTIGNTDYPGKRNASGFTAFPGSYRSSGRGSFYNYIGYNGHWWSSSEYNADNAYYRSLDYSDVSMYRGNGSSKTCGFSVRCIKD